MTLTLSALLLVIAVVLLGAAAFWEAHKDRLFIGGVFFFAASFLASALTVTPH